MSEEMLIRHCAPTLAGMKTGNLFSCVYHQKYKLCSELCRLNRILVPKGVRIVPLQYTKQRVLIYLYRPNRLKRDLLDGRASFLLRQYGYPFESPERCVAALVKKLSICSDFPHEIGLFLGYPPEDVKGFIEHKADHCKCVGCWKVYGDEEKARQTFCRYKKCTDIYCAQWLKGIGVEQLTVAV